MYLMDTKMRVEIEMAADVDSLLAAVTNNDDMRSVISLDSDCGRSAHKVARKDDDDISEDPFYFGLYWCLVF